MPGPYEFYAAFGLNDQEVSIIKHATPKRHYYISSPDGKRLIDLALGPIALAFMAVSDKEKVARVKQLIAIHGDNWPGEWLNEQGIPYEQYLA